MLSEQSFHGVSGGTKVTLVKHLSANFFDSVVDSPNVSGGNCIKIGLPRKLILRDVFQENRTSRRPFLLPRISFPGRPICIQFVPGDVGLLRAFIGADLTGELFDLGVHPLHVPPQVVLLRRLEAAHWAQKVLFGPHVVHELEVRLEDL